MVHWIIPFAVLTTFPAVVVSQSRPDFTGEWIRADSTTEVRSVASVGDAGFRVGTMGSGWGSPLTLRHEENRLVVEYTFFGTYDLQPRLSFTFALDGSESRNSVMIGHTESTLRSRTAWRGDTLVITTQYSSPAGATETVVRQKISIASPTSLVIQTSRGESSPPNRFVYSKR
jgi:hypothetical protein